MTRRTRNRTGFTLIEILIVVVILGILAAVVIPQFTNAADSANVASARTQLQTMRSQIELYRAQESEYPTGPWTDLIAGDYMRSSPTWPTHFTESYNDANGLLTLALDSDTDGDGYFDADGDGDLDSDDVDFVAGW